MIQFIIKCLAVWRICNLIVYESGPFNIFELFRNKLKIQTIELPNGKIENYSDNELGKLFSCIWCLSPYIGLIVFLIFKRKFFNVMINSLALSGATIMINKYMDN